MVRTPVALMACALLSPMGAIGVAAAAPAAVVPMAGSAAGSGVTRLSVRYEVRADGVLEVTETIEYDYGTHGFPLVRAVRLRQPSNGNVSEPARQRGMDRVWEVFDISASSPTGADASIELTEQDPMQPNVTGIDGWDSRLLDLHIRVGEALPYLSLTPEARTFPSRPETFILHYRVRGALDRLSDGYALNWPVNLRASNTSDVVGRLRADLTAPSELMTASCTGHRLDGSWRTYPCQTSKTAREAHFVFAPTGERQAATAMEIATRLGASGITQGGAMFDKSPTPRSVRIRQLLIATAILVALTIVIVVVRRRRSIGGIPADRDS